MPKQINRSLVLALCVYVITIVWGYSQMQARQDQVMTRLDTIEENMKEYDSTELLSYRIEANALAIETLESKLDSFDIKIDKVLIRLGIE